jgi:hypothetical protein
MALVDCSIRWPLYKKELKTLKILSCISKGMWLNLLTIEINYGFILNGKIIIKG